MPHVDEEKSHAGHDDELCGGADKDIEGTAGEDSEILRGEREAHGEHDDAEDDGLCRAAHPVEDVREEECQHRNGDDEGGCVVA